MIFEKASIEARAAVIDEYREQLEACNVACLLQYMLTYMGLRTSHVQEYQKNITDAEGIYLAHDRRHPDANH